MLRIIMALCLILFLTVPGYAQPREGNWELTLSGTGSSSSDFDRGSAGVAAGVGYFFIPAAELSLRQVFVGSFPNHGDNIWAGASSSAFDWHFDLGRLQPFIGVEAGWRYGREIEDAWFAGPEIGLKYYVHPDAFIYGRVEYQFDLAHGENHAFIYAIGIGANW